MSKLTIKVEHFKALRSNSLYGFADVLIPELHLIIREAPVHEGAGRRWINMPAKPQANRDGTVRRDAAGKVLYSSILAFTDQKTRDAFSARAIEALLQSFPNAFADGDAA